MAGFFGIGDSGPDTGFYKGGAGGKNPAMASALNSVIAGAGDAYNQNQPDLGRFGESPYSSPLSDMLKSYQAPKAISAPGMMATPESYKAKNVDSVGLPQYDAMRTRINTQYSQTQAQAQDALDRQFAASGGGPGNGAQAKQTENLAGEIAKQKGSDLQDVSAQEAQARFGLQQQEVQREYQSGEASKGYGFQAAQTKNAQDFAAQQFNVGQENQANQFKFNAYGTIAGLNTAWDQAQQEAVNNEYNKALSEYQAKNSGGLLGGGGFLGTGLF